MARVLVVDDAERVAALESDRWRHPPAMSRYSDAELAEFVTLYIKQGLTYGDLADVYLNMVDNVMRQEERVSELRAVLAVCQVEVRRLRALACTGADDAARAGEEER